MTKCRTIMCDHHFEQLIHVGVIPNQFNIISTENHPKYPNRYIAHIEGSFDPKYEGKLVVFRYGQNDNYYFIHEITEIE